MTALVWFGRDLRIADNPALYQACADGHKTVIGLYLITPDLWQAHDDAECKIAFWLDNLNCLQQQLQTLNIPLLIVECKQTEINSVFDKLFIEYGISELYTHQEIEPDEQTIKNTIRTLCHQHRIKINCFHQCCILPPGTVLKNDDSPYTIFTPFKKKWLAILQPDDFCLYQQPKKQKILSLKSTSLETWLERYRDRRNMLNVWPAGEKAAQLRLRRFCKEKIGHYHAQRDYPSVSGTSQLSAYLTAGVLSAKQCLAAAMSLRKNEGIDTWINELIWRDFYYHILYFFPRVGKHQAFKSTTDKIKWNNDTKLFQAWCEGQTGIPIIDAAMRQLNQTGWMHNRLRMITAMFLSKNLWIDWRWGERYFMQHLIDGDLASNNGGWQWSASTGTDAVPYFRIFNPYSQSQRFDAKGDFIRHYCPELAHLDDKAIHQPPKMANYPEPIVDVKVTRQAAIAAFRAIS